MRIRHAVRRALGASALLFIVHGSASAAETLITDPSRIVSIGGSITEIVYALGEEKKLVGRDSTSVHPEAVFQVPDVGYMRALSPEGVLSVNPSGIIAIQGSGPKEAVEVLKKASVPYVEVPDVFTHAGIVEKVKLVGQALGVGDKAEKLAAEIDADLTTTDAIVAQIKERKRVLFVLSFQDGKILGAGDHTAAGGMLALSGADNAVAGFPGYKQLTDEAIIEAKPDVILMMNRPGAGGDHGAIDAQLVAHPAIASTPAGQNKAIVRMDGAYLLGFGPRTAAAARELAATLYGSALPQN